MFAKFFTTSTFILLSFLSIAQKADTAFTKKFHDDDLELLRAWNTNPESGHKLWLQKYEKAATDKKVYYEVMGIIDALYNDDLKRGLKIIRKIKTQVEQSSDSLLKRFYYLNSADFYATFQNYQLSNIHIQKAMEFVKDSSDFLNCQFTLSSNYLEMGMPQPVISFFEKQLIKDLESNAVSGVLYDYLMLTDAHNLNRTFDKAKYYLDRWKALIEREKQKGNTEIEFELSYPVSFVNWGIDAQKQDYLPEIEANLKQIQANIKKDPTFLREYLSAKERYFKWLGNNDSSAIYSQKLADFVSEQSKERLQLSNEIEEEEAREKQNSRTILAIGIGVFMIFLAATAYFYLKHQRKKATEKIESTEQVLGRYSAILKDKYTVISQTETKLNELHSELKDDKLIRKIRELKSTIKLSEEELSFLKEFNREELSVYEKLRKTFPQMTETELRIIFFILKDKSSSVIAETIKISEKAIENHRYRIRKKLSLAKEQSLEQTLKSHLKNFEG